MTQIQAFFIDGSFFFLSNAVALGLSLISLSMATLLRMRSSTMYLFNFKLPDRNQCRLVWVSPVNCVTKSIFLKQKKAQKFCQAEWGQIGKAAAVVTAGLPVYFFLRKPSRTHEGKVVENIRSFSKPKLEEKRCFPGLREREDVTGFHEGELSANLCPCGYW